jgi:hypothetical protein
VLEAARRTLHELSARYGSYAHDRLVIVQTPRATTPARLVGDVLLLPEELVFDHAPNDPRYDYVLYETARLVARHWFIDRVLPRRTAGEVATTEGLPTAVALSIVEGVRGREALVAHVDRESERFVEAVAHASDDVVPLARALHAAKPEETFAGLALHGLRRTLGPNAFDGAVKAWLGGRDRSLATLAPLLTALDAEVTKQALEDILVFDNSVKEVEATLDAEGRRRVVVRVATRAFAVEGRDFRPRSAGAALDVALVSREGAIVSMALTQPSGPAEAAVMLAPSGEPASALVDPFRARVERNAKDNFRRLEDRRTE